MTLRRGEQWGARDTTRDEIESPEWVEVDDVIGAVACFSLGLPYHRRSAPICSIRCSSFLARSGGDFSSRLGSKSPALQKWRWQLLTAGQPCNAVVPWQLTSPRGWMLHVAAKNSLVTHLEPLSEPSGGVRMRLLETEGRETRTAITAYKPFAAARLTDFRGNQLEVLSVNNGRVEVELGPHRWLQIEAEWESVEGRESKVEGRNE